MNLGAFSISLAVRDINASREFYEKLGFVVFGGDAAQNWLMMKQGSSVIGLFQGMFQGNVLTFNPGWNAEGEPVDPFDDVRALQTRLLAAGLTLTAETDPKGTGPAHITLTDPDGNAILIDQHR
jgi:lactoylglutathione lyase